MYFQHEISSSTQLYQGAAAFLCYSFCSLDTTFARRCLTCSSLIDVGRNALYANLPTWAITASASRSYSLCRGTSCGYCLDKLSNLL
jgi:hypothetical protein